MRVGTLAVALLMALACRAQGQNLLQNPRAYPEYRADVLVGSGTTVQGGVGIAVPLGVYVRLGLDAAAGATFDHDEARSSERFDAVARFLLDPFREVPVGLSMGGGASLRYTDGGRVKPYLVAVVDIEGRRHGGITPAMQVGLGGGARVSVILRQSVPKWR